MPALARSILILIVVSAPRVVCAENPPTAEAEKAREELKLLAAKRDDREFLGFEPADDVSQAVLGRPIKQFWIRGEDFRYGIGDPEQLFKGGEWVFPVLVACEMRSLIILRLIKGEWIPVAFGYGELARVVGRAGASADDAYVPCASKPTPEAPPEHAQPRLLASVDVGVAELVYSLRGALETIALDVPSGHAVDIGFTQDLAGPINGAGVPPRILVPWAPPVALDVPPGPAVDGGSTQDLAAPVAGVGIPAGVLVPRPPLRRRSLSSLIREVVMHLPRKAEAGLSGR
jgi:hypothetical protein